MILRLSIERLERIVANAASDDITALAQVLLEQIKRIDELEDKFVDP